MSSALITSNRLRNIRRFAYAAIAVSAVGYGFAFVADQLAKSQKDGSAVLTSNLGDFIEQKTYTNMFNCTTIGRLHNPKYNMYFAQYGHFWSNNVTAIVKTDQGPFIRYAIRKDGSVYHDGRRVTDPTVVERQNHLTQTFHLTCAMIRNRDQPEQVQTSPRSERRAKQLFGIPQKMLLKR